jgi:hypothetical protein
MVAAPRYVDGVDPALFESEPGPARGEQNGGIGSGAPAAAFAHVRAEGEFTALRGALAQVVSGGVEDLGRVPGNGEDRQHRLHGVARGAVVAQRHPLVEEPRRADPQLEVEAEAGLGVGEGDRRAMLVRLDPDDVERRAEPGAVAVAFQSRSPEPALGSGRDQCERRCRVETA